MIQRHPAPWQAAALVCRKCSRKADGGFGPEGGDKLAKTLRRALKAAGRRRELRVIEVGCLGLCPKQAVTLAIGDTLLAVPPGTTPEAILDALPPARGAA